jgi:hypothetical protein
MPLVESKASLPWSQEPTTFLYPQPEESCPSCSCKTHFNVLPSTPRSTKWSLSYRSKNDFLGIYMSIVVFRYWSRTFLLKLHTSQYSSNGSITSSSTTWRKWKSGLFCSNFNNARPIVEIFFVWFRNHCFAQYSGVLIKARSLYWLNKCKW